MVVLEELEPVDIDPRPLRGGDGAEHGGVGDDDDDDDMPPEMEEIPGSELSVPIKVGQRDASSHNILVVSKNNRTHTHPPAHYPHIFRKSKKQKKDHTPEGPVRSASRSRVTDGERERERERERETLLHRRATGCGWRRRWRWRNWI